MDALAAVAGRAALETRARGTAQLRETILEALYEALRDGLPVAVRLLTELRDESGLPDDLKKEVAARLAGHTQVARPGR